MESVFLNLLNMSIMAGWIVLAAVVLRFLLKKAPKALVIILWAIVGLRLLLPVSIESVLSLIPSAQTVPESILTAEVPKIDSGFTVVNNVINPILPRGDAQALPDAATYETAQAGTSVNPIALITRIAAVVWLLGMVALFFYAAMSFLRLKKRVEESICIRENIYICDHVSSPFVLGLIRPKIFLPSDLPEDERTFVIAHERAHICRHDQIFKPLGFLLLAVYWFNPLMWVAYILFCRDIEFACDERVLLEMGSEAKKPYSEALIECSVPRRMIAACPLAFGEVDVKNRVKSVLNYKKPAFWVVILAIVACIATGVFFLTNPVKAKTDYSELLLSAEPVEFNAMEDDTEEIYSVNKNLPSGYTLSLPFVEHPTLDEWREIGRNREDHNLHEIEISKGEELVFTVDFYNRRSTYQMRLENWKDMASRDPDSNSEIVKLIKEQSSDDLNYALFSVERSYAESEPHANYFMFIGELPKSQNTAFDIRSYTTQEEAEMLFTVMDLKFLRDEGNASDPGGEGSSDSETANLIVQGRAMLCEANQSIITYHAPLPEGYTIRNNFDLEHQEESFKREELGEIIPAFDILKDGEPVVSVTPHQANPVRASRSELKTSIYSSEGDYLDDQARDDARPFLYDFIYENTYIMDFPFFPLGAETSLYLTAVYDKEEAERFFEVLDFRCEAKEGNPLWEAKQGRGTSTPAEPVASTFDWNAANRIRGSVDYDASITNCEQPVPFHIEYSVPEGYEVTFPNLWARDEQYLDRYQERMSKVQARSADLNSRIYDVELLKDGELVFGFSFNSKPAYYESYLRVMAYSVIPRQEGLILHRSYYDDVAQIQKNGCLYTVGTSVSLQSEGEVVSSKFAMVDLLESQKMAASMRVAVDDTLEHLLEYADWFKISVTKEPTEILRGLIRTENDPIPTLFAKETIENKLGRIAVGYYTYEGYEVSFPRKSDPNAENEIEVTKNGELIYSAKIISKEELNERKAQLEADSDYSAVNLVSSPNSELEKVGKREFDFKKQTQNNAPPTYYSLIEFLESDAALLCEQHWPEGDGTVRGTSYPNFNYSLLQ